MIGKFHNRITFQSKTSTSDGAGGYVYTTEDYYTCWAQIVTDADNKTNILSKDSLSNDINFRIRYTTSKTFDNKLIINYKDNLYLINSVVNQGDKNEYFIIGCSTLKNG